MNVGTKEPAAAPSRGSTDPGGARDPGGAGAVVPAARLAACPECDLLQREPARPARGRVHCVRCGALLYRKTPGGLRLALAWATAAAVLFVIANVSPIVSLEAQGILTSATLLGTARALQAQHLSSVAGLVLFTAMLMPALEVGLFLYVLAVLRFRPGPRCFPLALRLIHAARPWSMIEVLVLGTLAALAKLVHLARIQLGPALWSFGALMALMAAIPTTFDVREPAVRVTGRRWRR